MKNKILKTVLSIIAIALVLVSLTACGNKNEKSKEKSSKSETTVEDEEIEVFNRSFLSFEGKQNAVNFRRLLDIVIINNNKETIENRIAVIYKGEEKKLATDLIAIKNEVDENSEYDISFEHNEKGRISTVIVK